MRSTRFVLVAVGSLVLGVPRGAGHDPVPSDTQVRPGASRPLTDDERWRLDRIIARVEKRPGRSLAVEARTLEEARKLAEVEKRNEWAAEYEGWFVFTPTRLNDRPNFWDVTLVKKGTKKAVYFRQVW